MIYKIKLMHHAVTLADKVHERLAVSLKVIKTVLDHYFNIVDAMH